MGRSQEKYLRKVVTKVMTKKDLSKINKRL